MKIIYLFFVLLFLILGFLFLFGLGCFLFLFFLFLLFWWIWFGNVRVQLHFFTDCLVPVITPGAILLFWEK